MWEQSLSPKQYSYTSKVIRIELLAAHLAYLMQCVLEILRKLDKQNKNKMAKIRMSHVLKK